MSKYIEQWELPDTVPEGGRLHVGVMPPGAWFDSDQYRAFVGGGGIGGFDTLEEAREAAWEYARETYRRTIRESEAIITHCEDVLRKLAPGSPPNFGEFAAVREEE